MVLGLFHPLSLTCLGKKNEKNGLDLRFVINLLGALFAGELLAIDA